MGCDLVFSSVSGAFAFLKPDFMHSGTLMSGKGAVLLLAAAVLLPALLIRIHPVVSESFGFDTTVSQMAAAKGFSANAMDRGDILMERRGHPPLLSYIIIVNNALFGSGVFGARIFSIIAGSLCCLAVSMAIVSALEGVRLRIAAAAFGGLMLCLLPVHLYVSRTANWDAVYSLFATCSLLLLSLYLLRNSRGLLLGAGILAALAFLTCEIALLLVPSFVFVLYRDLRRKPARAVFADWLLLLAVSAAVCFVLWPASILKLDAARMIRFRMQDSLTARRALPWYMFYSELLRQSPAFALASLFGLSAFLLKGRMRRLLRGEERERASAAYGVLAPFAVYVVAGIVVSTQNKLVHLHHISDIFPPLAVLFSCSIGFFAAAVKRAGKILLLACCLAALGFSIASVTNPDPEVVGPQEHPGFLGIRDYFRNRTDVRVYFFYDFLMPYYLPQEIFEGTPPRRWTGEKVDYVKGAGYDYVVTDLSMVSNEYPDIEVLAGALQPEYGLVHTILHRRTGEPVAWILAHTGTPGPR